MKQTVQLLAVKQIKINKIDEILLESNSSYSVDMRLIGSNLKLSLFELLNNCRRIATLILFVVIVSTIR